MDEIRCSIKIEDRAEGARLVGVLLPFNTEARDRRELFEPGSVTWDEGGVTLRRQHNRQQPILKFTPVDRDGALTVDVPIPKTAAGADCEAEIRSGLLTSLSVEFRATKQTMVAGVRRISAALLVGAGLVDSGAYAEAVVEARELAANRARAWREYIL